MIGRILYWRACQRLRAIEGQGLDPASVQRDLLLRLVRRAKETRFGREHGFGAIRSPEEFREAAKDALIVDVRPVEEYVKSHLPGSLSVAFRSSYATWLGWLAPLGTPLLFVLGSVRLDGVIDESLLIGQERFAGWLEGGLGVWESAGLPVVSTQMVDATGVRDLAGDGATLVDVREPDEYAAGHIPGAIQMPLGTLQANLERIPRDRPAVTYCAMGERSASAASILERGGFAAVRNLDGGIEAWLAAGQRIAV